MLALVLQSPDTNTHTHTHTHTHTPVIDGLTLTHVRFPSININVSESLSEPYALIRVHAAALNRRDEWMRVGLYPRLVVMCVCVCVCVCVLYICMYVYIKCTKLFSVLISPLYETQMRTHTHTHAHINIHTHTYTHAYTRLQYNSIIGSDGAGTIIALSHKQQTHTHTHTYTDTHTHTHPVLKVGSRVVINPTTHWGTPRMGVLGNLPRPGTYVCVCVCMCVCMCMYVCVCVYACFSLLTVNIIYRLSNNLKHTFTHTHTHMHIHTTHTHIYTSFAEYICLPLRDLHIIPSHLSFTQASALPVAAATAYRALFTRGYCHTHTHTHTHTHIHTHTHMHTHMHTCKHTFFLVII